MDINNTLFTDEEKDLLKSLLVCLNELAGDSGKSDDFHKVKQMIIRAAQQEGLQRNHFGLNPVLFNLQTAIIAADEINVGRAAIISILLHGCVSCGSVSLEEVEKEFGSEIAKIIRGLIRVNQLYARNTAIETDNFRSLLLSFAEDMRVVFIIIADRVNLMRQIKDRGTDEERRKVALEASQLYAPLAHKLGLYAIKSELEDLSLKYLEHDAYYMIKDKLNETKRARDAYIARFIRPIQEKLEHEGLKFHIKGRTKSIHSIWQKMKKQKCGFENVYDLFAIRIILDSPLDKEKQQCWQVYSIVSDMYKPNPKRLRDWLSVPKSNGYESLHTTVMGPEGRWVEIQIRTERMDDIAEHGLAAHWRYKGVKGGGTRLEEWLADIRSSLEAGATSDEQLVDQFKVDLYSDEVFVFTPKGDLFKLPKGATVLDFAFQIHTGVGSHCTGGKVNGKNVPMRTRLQSGDQVEILTSPHQSPKRDWLKMVITSKAKTKIRQSLHEEETRAASFAKETLSRKLRNKKIDYDEASINRLIVKMGYKYINEFYKAIQEEVIDVNDFIERYAESIGKGDQQADEATTVSAENFVQQTSEQEEREIKDELIIDQNVKGVEYSLAKCCSPIYGDPIFGFVTLNRGIKIHRMNCPNAEHMRNDKGYRIIRARWAGKGNSQYAITLHVVGKDDIGIVNNITSIINKEKNVVLRSISINSKDGLFQGTLTVQIDEIKQLEALVKKLSTVKGVKKVSR
ncbi:MAG: bifunctional (p)ppGpp synthetase/guanosine-3',5'-bis(diphosphate) 3'-pyrophosphohydrolase [Bacteroidaceae bacterium]|nr:bifunctional (p)ppGpp synthetase/guanosine-3',5'-bis(diphosphate) 3'-pyrophosphohydrolase [Bacteroidaceae bacterium]